MGHKGDTKTQNLQKQKQKQTNKKKKKKTLIKKKILKSPKTVSYSTINPRI